MSNYEYKVVPFIGRIKGKQNAQDVSEQLKTTISTKNLCFLIYRIIPRFFLNERLKNSFIPRIQPVFLHG